MPFFFLVISSKKVHNILIVAVFINFFTKIDVLKIKYNAEGTEAIDAEVSLFFEKGVVFQDIEKRPYIQQKYMNEKLSNFYK